uniref:XPG-I domain-containing protein n=1 Tax=Clastoptera arizonana TaxID=38151 RepID=A0A1B6DDU3_9HEMI
MGVRGLQTYTEKVCKNVCVEVKIEDLVNQYKLDTGIQNPVVVVDALACYRHLYADLEWVTGPQTKEFKEQLKFFVSQFKKLGITLVFFFDGPTPDVKRCTWVQRRMDTMIKVYKIMDLLKDGNKTTDVSSDLFMLPIGLNSFVMIYLKEECNIEVYSAVEECDEEINAFAVQHNCFAVLSQDSDYMIYEGNYLYLSMKSLNLEKMTIAFYSRKELARNLGISLQDLPLFATLAGNDIISVDKLRVFHQNLVKRMCGSRAKTFFHILFPCIANYIKTFPRNSSFLINLANDVFRDESKASLIQSSIQSYSPKEFKKPERNNQPLLTGWEAIVEEFRYLHRTASVPTTLYSVINDLFLSNSTLMEDFRMKDLKTVGSAIRPLHQKAYGIIFHERPSENPPIVVKELVMEGPGSLDDVKLVQPIPPTALHPGLLAMWASKNDDRMLSIKYNLLVSSISTKIKVQKLICLPEHLKLPTLVFCYLIEEKLVHDWEVEAMLATAVVLELYSAARLKQLPKDPVSVRAIRIVPLLLRISSCISLINSILCDAIPKKYTTACNFFDGKLFQIKYREAEKKMSILALCDNEMRLMEDFQKVKSVLADIISNTNS